MPSGRVPTGRSMREGRWPRPRPCSAEATGAVRAVTATAAAVPRTRRGEGVPWCTALWLSMFHAAPMRGQKSRSGRRILARVCRCTWQRPTRVSSPRVASAEEVELPVLLGQQVVDGDAVLRAVALECLADLGQRGVELGVRVGEPELLLHESVTHAVGLGLVAERHEC